ncbi:radial spoke head protein 9 homolog [Protopterus annectens]|uniref:radial spoke head protein 9 homolog n=1 Tax=Protopterus annectens TaxID=7888 RepID=UPI001CF94D78|nr:radial spoke head protein 9 homolog [Protopterus annectens]
MDSESLPGSLEHVSGTGVVLTPEQKAALQVSLVILQGHYRFKRVLFWGKILGIHADYYIAQGIGQDEMHDKKNLYSLNCIDWNLLPPATDSSIAELTLIKGRFMGDPSHEYEFTKIKKTGTDDEAQEEEILVKCKEETRLAATIAVIDRDVAVVPRGAYLKTPLSQVEKNRSFQGLSVSEAVKIRSYFHLSEPTHLKKKTLLQQADLDPSFDFLDTLEEDIPKGSWSLQTERGSSLVVLRSLLWLGLTCYHIPCTSQYGYIYMGFGEKNMDLPFML